MLRAPMRELRLKKPQGAATKVANRAGERQTNDHAFTRFKRLTRHAAGRHSQRTHLERTSLSARLGNANGLCA